MKWISPAVYAALFAATWAAVFKGGMTGVWAWASVVGLWPLMALLVMIVTLITALLRRRIAAPALATLGVSLIALWPLAWSFGAPGMAYPSNPEKTAPASYVRPPASGPLRVAWGGDSFKVNRHSASSGQRWAYDLLIEPAGHGAADLASYGCFGAPVVAPATGLVHLAHDGENDMAIGESLADMEKLLGNHVVLKLENAGYLVIAHLKKGSVTAAQGEIVTEGDVIGACGNSGNTSEPHIHIHHQRQDPMMYDGKLNMGVNFVEGLPLYFHHHKGPAMPSGGVEIKDGKARFTGDIIEAN